ncbi:MAG: LLM class flavin-dependent oxidoreductase [Chloroflexi bacterium]|nr:LLM class flavin-dependent oxidoreductase [Chloroflexota bacterium]
MGMRYGLNFFPSFRLTDCSTADYYDQVLRLAERGDQLGYTSAKCVEHYFNFYGGHSPSPIVLLSAIAARTRYLRPITGAVIPAFNHPIKLAAELAMLDNICQGRLDVGFGRVFIPEEFDAFGVPMDESRQRFEEAVDVITRLWTEERVTHHGHFVRLDNIRLMPRPVQRPHPPIWIAAVATRASFEEAGRRGHHLMLVPYAGSVDRTAELLDVYTGAWAAAGHPSGGFRIQVSIHVYIAPTHAAAIEGFRRPVERYIEVFSDAMNSWEGRMSGDYAGYQQVVAGVRAQTPQKLMDSHTALVGTPGEVAEQLAYLRSKLGDFEPSMQINFGGMTDADAFRTLELFASEVVPKIDRTPIGE